MANKEPENPYQSKSMLKAIPTDYNELFYVKGPMGKGLQMSNKGLHIAFCAGTGSLIFLDLVAYLLIKNSFKKLSKIIPDNMKNLYDDFELHIYCSWENEEMGMGLGLEIMKMLV